MVKNLKVEEVGAEEILGTLENTVMTSDWEEYVRSEVTSLLDTLLPVCVSGNVGIIYKNLITEELEGGPVYDDTKAVGVDVVLSFDFGQEIVKPV